MQAFNEDFSELEIGTSVESFQGLLDSQRDLFHSQIDQLQRIVVAQCKLTGVNPLSQEMAAGALSIKIGKRPRDLLNPKAVKYMQSVFSIKDAISKKESREISALFGVTVTQVRDFFNSQRSRVRRVVRLSREKSIRSNACKESHDGETTCSDDTVTIDPVPLNTIGPTNNEEGPSCSMQCDDIPGIDGFDKQFVQNIFSLMRKEDTFSGQVKLMGQILQIQNSSVLSWFLNRGGVMILATWLTQAAAEEQTSFLRVILKVLCHLPLHKALPIHMSAVLQGVNKLRFYRVPDISNRARVFLSRWSKLLLRNQGSNGMNPLSDWQNEIILKQSIDEIMHNELWQSNYEITEDLSQSESAENVRKLESRQTLKLLPASSDDSSRKNILGLSSSPLREQESFPKLVTENRERRKVQLVEQPGQRMAGRSPQSSRTTSLNQARPMSADDIQKAKMRAQLLRSKHGKVASLNGNTDAKIDGLNKPLQLVSGSLPLASKMPPHPKIEENKKPEILHLKVTDREGASNDPKVRTESNEQSLMERCKRFQIQWQTPPEMRLSSLWRIGAGENSKEFEVQKTRNSREKETLYKTLLDIPSDPKEPWDIEMNYDDSLTPEILSEQLPDAEHTEAQGPHTQVLSTPDPAPSYQDVNVNTAEPDLELLAVLLKNPELVFALTSGQAGNLNSEETVILLDMIKSGGNGLVGSLNVLNQMVEKVEVSLPSPTPPSNPAMSGWKQEVAKNPFSRQASVAPEAAKNPFLHPVAMANTQVHDSSISAQANKPREQHYTNPQPLSLQVTSSFSLQQSTAPPVHLSSLTNLLTVQAPPSEKIAPFINQPPPVAATAALPPWVDGAASANINIERASLSNAPERSAVSFRLAQLESQSQRHRLEPLNSTPVHSLRVQGGKSIATVDSWGASHGFVSNYHSRSQANQLSYNALGGGSVQHHRIHLPPGPAGERSEEFESWSPENSPTPRRTPDPISGRSYSDRNYRSERPREQREHSGSRHGNRWRDRRH